jgi:hypothetical protein
LNGIELTWILLVAKVRWLERQPHLDQHHYLEMTRFLAALRLVQPFDWMHWPAPNLLDVDMEQLDIDDCVRYITRHIRGERFFENSIGPWIRGGAFGDLCEVAKRKANGQKAPLLPKAA